jgi:ribosomal protein S18 acetylase RimI-like enzyme
MIITIRPFTGAVDIERMIELVQTFPDQCLRAVDLPYRLASWALDNPRNASLWEDEAGRLLGFAVIQLPWRSIDTCAHPVACEAGIEELMLVWATERAQEIADKTNRALTVYVDAFEHDLDRLALLAAHGFAPGYPAMIRMSRSLDRVLPAPVLPDGFTLRPIDGMREVQEYVALHRAAFGAADMTIEWRKRTLCMPQYVPELDVVAVAPDGRLAAFCICWLGPKDREGYIEPLGVHPDFAGLGLGRAVLLEGLWRLQAHGATLALIDRYEGDASARALYESLGFRTHLRTVTYTRCFHVIQKVV